VRLGIAVRRPRRLLLGDTEVAAPLEIDDSRARAQCVIERRGLGRAIIGLRGPSVVGPRTHTAVVAGIIDPFRRSHIFAVVAA
jgi:hypothetical protein